MTTWLSLFKQVSPTTWKAIPVTTLTKRYHLSDTSGTVWALWSIYGIDYEYYADFLEKNKDTEVVVIYHNEDGKKEFENEMENRGVMRSINYEYIVISDHFFEFCKNIAEEQQLFFEKEK